MSDIDKPFVNDTPNVTLTLRMIMTGREVGSIIGKGGEIINNIRENSGAKIHISDGSVPERIVTVTGSTDAIFKSFNLICKKLEEDGPGERDGSHSSKSSRSGGSNSGTITLKLVVPASQCGSLIGKGGSKIKEIREESGASVQVASELLPNSTERTVTITGSKSAISTCIYNICCVMLESPPKGTTIPYTPKSGGGILNTGGRSSRGSHPDNPLASLLNLGSGASTLAAIASLAGSQIRDRRGSDRDHDRNGGSTQTYEVHVPNDMIGCIIGKGGSKIAEIRQISGAMIRISKSDDSERSSSSSTDTPFERQITITGNPDSVALARSLINMSLDLHKSKLDERDSTEGSRGRERERDRDRDHDRNFGSAGALGLAQLLAKPDALTTALTTLAGLSSLGSLGGGLLAGFGAANPTSSGSGHVSGMHRRGGGGGYGGSRSRDDDRGGSSRDSKRSKFAPY